MKTLKNKYLCYIIVYLTYAFSATSFFTIDPVKHLLFFIFLFGLFLITNPKVDKFLVIVFLFYSGLVLTQGIVYEGLVLKTYVTYFLFVILTPYLILKIIGLKFIKYFTNVMVFLSIISLVFWIAVNLSPSFFDFIQTIPKKYNTDLLTWQGNLINQEFIIYTVELSSQYGILRNPGQTWEPGAFVIFIIVAFIFNLMTGGKLSDKKSIILLITALTTFSTSGYISLGIILIYKAIKSHVNTSLKVLVIPLIAFFVAYSFLSFEFLGEKIQYQYNDAMSKEMTEGTSGRFFAARKDLFAISKYPIFGKGLHTATSKSLKIEEEGGYGLLNWAVKLGLIVFFLFYYYTYKSFKLLGNFFNQPKNDFKIYFITLLPLLFSQAVWNDSIFFILFFIYPIYKKYYPRELSEMQKVNLKHA